MSGSIFRFKQFAVAQGKCAMKVNTDGVLLGAWVSARSENCILDIGTGTGVIALMMAQKNPLATVHAIDIDGDAALQAAENFEQSNWAGRLAVSQVSLQDFEPGIKYDVIISNPPYFIDDQKTGLHQRDIAKHSVALTYDDLLAGISGLLAVDGVAAIVIPAFNLRTFEIIAQHYSLFVNQLTEVTAVAGKSPYLVLIQLGRNNELSLKSNLIIQNAAGYFTDEYKLLTKDFYLKF